MLSKIFGFFAQQMERIVYWRLLRKCSDFVNFVYKYNYWLFLIHQWQCTTWGKKINNVHNLECFILIFFLTNDLNAVLFTSNFYEFCHIQVFPFPYKWLQLNEILDFWLNMNISIIFNFFLCIQFTHVTVNDVRENKKHRAKSNKQ